MGPGPQSPFKSVLFKAVSSSRDFLKQCNMQKGQQAKRIQIIPSHFNDLKSNWQKPLF